MFDRSGEKNIPPFYASTGSQHIGSLLICIMRNCTKDFMQGLFPPQVWCSQGGLWIHHDPKDKWMKKLYSTFSWCIPLQLCITSVFFTSCCCKSLAAITKKNKQKKNEKKKKRRPVRLLYHIWWCENKIRRFRLNLALGWTGVPFAPSVPRIGSRATLSLTRIKWLLKCMNQWFNL